LGLWAKNAVGKPLYNILWILQVEKHKISQLFSIPPQYIVFRPFCKIIPFPEKSQKTDKCAKEPFEFSGII
jgi:hypothetical protein